MGNHNGYFNGNVTSGGDPQPRFIRNDATLVPSIAQRMWWNWIGKDNSSSIFLEIVFRSVRVEQIAQSVHSLIDAYEILRARYHDTLGKLEVELNSAAQFEAEYETVHDQSLKGLRGIAHRFKHKSFPASEEWLFRTKIVSLSASDHIVILVANHLIADGQSLRVLARQLKELVAGKIATPDLGGIVRFAEFVDWQNSWYNLAQPGVSAYWKQWSDRTHPLSPPGSVAPMLWSPGRKVIHEFLVPEPVHRILTKKSALLGATPFLVYLTLYAISIARWSGQSSFPLRCISDSRCFPELSQVVGLMMGSHAIDISFSSTLDFRNCLELVKADYFASSKLRNPTIYAFPPHATPDTPISVIGCNVIAAVINYQEREAVQEEGGPQQRFESAPVVLSRNSEIVHYPASPICLEFNNKSAFAIGALRVHADILSSEQQNALLQALFSTMLELALEK